MTGIFGAGDREGFTTHGCVKTGCSQWVFEKGNNNEVGEFPRLSDQRSWAGKGLPPGKKGVSLTILFTFQLWSGGRSKGREGTSLGRGSKFVRQWGRGKRHVTRKTMCTRESNKGNCEGWRGGKGI